MKIALGDEKIFEEAKRVGKAVLVTKNGKGGECCAKVGEFLTITTEARNLRETIECLADLGFEFAILKGFDIEIEGLEKGLGFKIPRAEKLEDLLKSPEIETVKSILENIKRGIKDCGAVGIFVGVVREISEGKKVEFLEYEAYTEILSEKIKEIEGKVSEFPGVRRAKIYHKLGRIMPGEDIVYIAVIGEHRRDIWAPLILAVELMKKELPIWKKEKLVDGERWV
ncbi:MAG: molybdenum cofactor biosynthesis protein MoaE [Archaeoglobus sp.]|nr:molybdenum cofactor biosynthesis protein MoaE [Archaeoglobus sp.]